MKVDQMITEDQEALYDRQIRLWGVDAQKKLPFKIEQEQKKLQILEFLYFYRLLAARILMINMSGLSAEIAKNLVLSGISRMTILDENEVVFQLFLVHFKN